MLGDILHLVERRAGVSIPEGSNPASTPLLSTLDPVAIAPRPFIWYLGISLNNYILRRWFQFAFNAKVGTYKGLEYATAIFRMAITSINLDFHSAFRYILRNPQSWSPKTGPRPIVFLHGLGLGLMLYGFFLSRLMEAVPDHPVLILLHPDVSQEIFHPRFLAPMGRHETAEALGSLLQELGWVDRREKGCGDLTENISLIPTGVTIISHSKYVNFDSLSGLSLLILV